VFTNLPIHQNLLKALDKMGINKPTPVQEQAIPPALEGEDLLVSAETGSGKTIAFLLPTMQRLLDTPDAQSGTRALILVPTRELARQILNQCLALGSYTQLKFGLIIGGERFRKQASLLRNNPEILIATPGRMLEHLQRNTPYFNDLEVLILDEADRMLDMGFSEDVLQITSECNAERQTMLFSATLSHQGLKSVASKILKDPHVLSLNNVKDKHDHIQQQFILADDNHHKIQIVNWLLNYESLDKTLVFTNTRIEAENVGDALKRAEHRTGILHGEMDQNHRNLVIQRLRDGKNQVLVATDVAARGLDIKGIDMVINFDMARNGKDYVHRIGRTGRAGEQGLAISLISHNEWNQKAGIERYLRQKMDKRTIEEMQGQYQGPKKVKASGKAAGSKRKKTKNKLAKKQNSVARKQKSASKQAKPTSQSSTDQTNAETTTKKPGQWSRLRKNLSE
jgi:superfamily II DNA/RNA helicase